MGEIGRLDKSSEDILVSFWETQVSSLPLQQHLARRILCNPATSTAVSTPFSSAGVIEVRRSRLNPGTVDALLILLMFMLVQVSRLEKIFSSGGRWVDESSIHVD